MLEIFALFSLLSLGLCSTFFDGEKEEDDVTSEGQSESEVNFTEVRNEQEITAENTSGDPVFSDISNGSLQASTDKSNIPALPVATGSVLIGNQSDDTLYGTNGDDVLLGGEGSDYSFGREGQDVLHGGLGGDILHGENGGDAIYGEGGDDTIEGNDCDDTLYGDAGIDQIFGSIGNDVVYGGSEDDFLVGGSGDDEINGGEGDDFIWGHGSDGVDDGEDYLLGDLGDDIIVIGFGDTVFGGDGSDKYIVLADSAQSGKIYLGDYDESQDRLVIMYDTTFSDDPEIACAKIDGGFEIFLDGHSIAGIITGTQLEAGDFDLVKIG